MTWIKPSFLWMMYRSGWATKPGQERILAIRISRTGFDESLRDACLSHYDPAIYADHNEWLHCKERSPNRVQWDPERSLRLEPLPWRAIQIGLAGLSVDRYVSHWITHITDVTPVVIRIRSLLDEHDHLAAKEQLPIERPYPLSANAANTIGATI